MKENIKALAIIFSVVLNIVFIGSYFYHKIDSDHLTGSQAGHNHFLTDELNLSREQLDKFEPIRTRFHAFLNRQGDIIKHKRLELIDILSKGSTTIETITAKEKEIQTLQHQMQSEVIDHLFTESRIFTPEQRAHFFALIRRRIEKSVGPHPPWMSQTKISPSKGEE